MHTGPAGVARLAVAEPFATPISAPTENRCRVQMYSAGQLGNDATQLEQLCMGSVGFAITAAGTEGTNIRMLTRAALPCFRDGYAQFWMFDAGSALLRAEFDRPLARGSRIVSVREAGFRRLSRRMKLRLPPEAAWQEGSGLPKRRYTPDRGKRRVNPRRATHYEHISGDPARRGSGTGKPDRPDLCAESPSDRGVCRSSPARLRPNPNGNVGGQLEAAFRDRLGRNR